MLLCLYFFPGLIGVWFVYYGFRFCVFMGFGVCVNSCGFCFAYLYSKDRKKGHGVVLSGEAGRI